MRGENEREIMEEVEDWRGYRNGGGRGLEAVED